MPGPKDRAPARISEREKKLAHLDLIDALTAVGDRNAWLAEEKIRAAMKGLGME